MLLPLIVRSRWATHAANNCAFNAAKSLASGTGTKKLRRYQPSSPSTPPFSLRLAGLQYSLRYPQCERNAMIRSVSMRCRPRKIFLTRSEEHTSELQSPCNLVCRLLLEKKKTLQECARYIT